MPASENALTGFALGSSLNGLKPILVHQRADFALLSLDQIINGAAKWMYMFGGTQNVPITIRMIIGRGWGQGPTHSQNLHAWFAHIPGLKVVIPAFASDVKGLLTAAIRDPNPVVFIEDRWIHSQLAEIGELKGDVPLGVANLVTTGDNLTLVSSGYMSVLALKAVKYAKEKGLKIDLIDLRTIKPLDEKMILESVKKTGRLIVVDSGVEFGSFGAYIISRISSYAFDYLKIAPKLLASPDVPEPTSHGVIEEFKITPIKIAESIFEIMNLDIPNDLVLELKSSHHDVPDSYFTGPF